MKEISEEDRKKMIANQEIFLCIGLIYPISHIIEILYDPIITFSLYDQMVWFTACILIVLIIIDIIFIISEIEYLYYWGL